MIRSNQFSHPPQAPIAIVTYVILAISPDRLPSALPGSDCVPVLLDTNTPHSVPLSTEAK